MIVTVLWAVLLTTFQNRTAPFLSSRRIRNYTQEHLWIKIPLSLLDWDALNNLKYWKITPQLFTARWHSWWKQIYVLVHFSCKSHLSTWGMANMKASWNMIHRVPVRKYGPNLRASVLSRKKPELCSFCSFLRSWAWSGSLLPSATPDAKAFSCLPGGEKTVTDKKAVSDCKGKKNCCYSYHHLVTQELASSSKKHYSLP